MIVSTLFGIYQPMVPSIPIFPEVRYTPRHNRILKRNDEDSIVVCGVTREGFLGWKDPIPYTVIHFNSSAGERPWGVWEERPTLEGKA